MADFDLTTVEQVAADTLPLFNVRPYEPDQASPRYNPYGFDKGGYLIHQMVQADMSRVMGLLARRMAMLARADVALTHADVKLTAEDAKNTALDRIASALSVTAAAGKVTDAAKEVTKAATEADRARDEADRARSFAAGLKMPAITPAVAGWFVKVSADGLSYELGLIETATTAQLLASTGSGYADAKTLGPLLADMRTKTDDNTGALVPIGGYVVVPFAGQDPGSKFVRANGQKISLATYPKASALPVLSSGDFGQNPWVNYAGFTVANFSAGVPNQTGANSAVATMDLVGNRAVMIQNEYLRYWELAGKVATVSREASFSLSDIPYDRSCVLRDNEVIVLRNSDGRAKAVSVASANFGSVSLSNNTAPTALNDQTKLIELKNGTILHFYTQSGGNLGIARLRKGEAPATAWAIMSVGGSTTPQPDYRVWLNKQGVLFLACRLSASGNYFVYKTADGESFTLVGEIPNSSGGGLGVHFTFNTRDARRLANPHYRESTDGQQILVRCYGQFIASSDGGLTWGLLNQASVMPTLPAYISNESRGTGVFEWDRYRNRWLFGLIWNRNTQVFAALYASSDLVSFTALQAATYIGVTTSQGYTLANYSMFVSADDAKMCAVADSGQIHAFRYRFSTGEWASNFGESLTIWATVVLEGWIDGYAALASRSPTRNVVNDVLTANPDGGIVWLNQDGVTEPLGSREAFQSGYPVRWFFFNDTYVFGGHAYGWGLSQRYHYNPQTERIVPRVTGRYSVSGSLPTVDISEYYPVENGGYPHGPRYYVRVN